ncbi:MAG TPA: carboxylating nicotinate-nucleotide diphosphorylase [Candidatus Bathyarchaeia archaeon]|nr:carboxylating nicotinate-nucleotide diphosphorylase [Candidatus Bathyarchaeia archaeon]
MDGAIMFLPREILEQKLQEFLKEDLGHGDVTTFATIPAGVTVEAEVRTKEAGVIAGLEEAIVLGESLGVQVKTTVVNGAEVKPKTVLLKIIGDARTLLSMERTLLNLLSRMSGIATTTKQIVEKIRKAGYKTRIASTRKVAPGLAYFDKKAVVIGSGDAHRSGLDDMVLIKDNHIAIAGGATQAVRKARESTSFSKKIEIEVTNSDDAVKVAEAKVDVIMLDNLQPTQIKDALEKLEKKRLRNHVLVEASGRINEKNVLEFAATGVDILSLGEITQNAKALDMNLKVVKVRKK